MALFGSKKRVLVVGNEGIILFGAAALSGIEKEVSLTWDTEGFVPQLAAALSRQRKNDPVLVLFDGADQTYRKEENIPKLSSFDRPRFIQRKLEQSFPNYPIRASFEIAAQKQRGAQPSYLFVAIPETDNIDKVAEALLEAGVPIAGFGLLPAESAGLATALSAKLFGRKGRKSRWSVLIAQHETGGLRQVIVKDGRLALTRITPASEAGVRGAGWVDDVLREFKATLTYIARFGYVAEDGLDVVVVCGDAEKKIFDQKPMPVTNFQCLKASEALSAIGARGRDLGEAEFGDALHAAWAGKKTFLEVPIKVPSIQRILAPRLAARLACVAMGLLLLVMAGLSAYLYSGYPPLQDGIAQKQQQRGTLAKEYEREQSAVDALPVRPALIRTALGVRDGLTQSSLNVAPVLTLLRKALDPDVRVEELTIEHDPTPVAAKGPPRGAQPGQPQKPPPGDARGLVKIIFRFTLPDGIPLEQKVARSESIAETMGRAFPGYEIRINAQFGRISRTGKFEGSAGGESAAPAPDKGAGFAEIEMRGALL